MTFSDFCLLVLAAFELDAVVLDLQMLDDIVDDMVPVEETLDLVPELLLLLILFAFDEVFFELLDDGVVHQQEARDVIEELFVQHFHEVGKYLFIDDFLREEGVEAEGRVDEVVLAFRKAQLFIFL